MRSFLTSSVSGSVDTLAARENDLATMQRFAAWLWRVETGEERDFDGQEVVNWLCGMTRGDAGKNGSASHSPRPHCHTSSASTPSG